MEAHADNDTTTSFADHELIDDYGDKLGTVTDVISDDRTLEPRWMVVDPGLLRAKHYVPTVGSYRTAEGRIVTPFKKEMVHDSPKVHGDHVLTPEVERSLLDYYGLATR